MRWTSLYARSRQVPASLAAVLISTFAVWAFCQDGKEGPADPRLTALVLAAGTTAGSIGLAGQDLALDRTAAIRWVPRRALHVLLIGAAAGGALLAVQTVGEELATTGFVLRDTAGLMGLVALGAVVFGAQNAWTLPLAWLAFTLFTPLSEDLHMQVATWMLLPPGTAAGTWTALVLAVGGTAVYAFAGPRR